MPATPPVNHRLLVWMAAGLALGLCLAWLARVLAETRAPTAGGPDRFAVLSVSPQDGAVSASTTSIELVFSLPADLGSVRDHLTLAPAVKGTFQSAGNAIRFVPEKPFPIGQPVMMALTAGVTSEDGSQLLEAGTTWTFEIRQPKAIYLSPSTPPHRLMMSEAQPESSPQDTAPGTRDVTEFSVSPGGDQLAVVMANAAGGGDVWSLDPDGFDLVQRTACGVDTCADPVWLPDRNPPGLHAPR